MNRRDFLKTFAAGSAIASFPFALKLAEVPIYQGNVGRTKAPYFDPSQSYGNMVMISPELEGKAFDQALNIVVDNAKTIIPTNVIPGYRIQILYHDPSTISGIGNVFDEVPQLGWRYSPHITYSGRLHLGVITL